MSLFGTTQTLTYGSSPSQIQVVLTNKNFAPGSGEGHLPQLGYDRHDDQAHLLTLARTAMGAPRLARPVYKPFQIMSWRLKLDQTQLLALWGMWKRQQSEQLPVIVTDQRLAMLESTPRVRAKIGTVPGVTAPAGCTVFWPQMTALLLVNEDWEMLYNCALTTGSAILNMSATEMYFLTPATYDIA
jgi:hypothetical protein